MLSRSNVITHPRSRIVLVCQAENSSDWLDRSAQDLVRKYGDDYQSDRKLYRRKQIMMMFKP